MISKGIDLSHFMPEPVKNVHIIFLPKMTAENKGDYTQKTKRNKKLKSKH